MKKLIITEFEYEQTLHQLEQLLINDPLPGSEDGNTIKFLSLLITNYENQHYQISEPNPIDAIKFRIDQETV